MARSGTSRVSGSHSSRATGTSRRTSTSAKAKGTPSGGSTPSRKRAPQGSATRSGARSGASSAASANASSRSGIASSAKTSEPKAVALRFHPGFIEVELADGRHVFTPLSLYPTLESAKPKEREDWEWWETGLSVEWPKFDLQLSISGIVEGRREHIPPPGYWEDLRRRQREAGMKQPPPRERSRRANRTKKSS